MAEYDRHVTAAAGMHSPPTSAPTRASAPTTHPIAALPPPVPSAQPISSDSVSQFPRPSTEFESRVSVFDPNYPRSATITYPYLQPGPARHSGEQATASPNPDHSRLAFHIAPPPVPHNARWPSSSSDATFAGGVSTAPNQLMANAPRVRPAPPYINPATQGVVPVMHGTLLQPNAVPQRGRPRQSGVSDIPVAVAPQPNQAVLSEYMVTLMPLKRTFMSCCQSFPPTTTTPQLPLPSSTNPIPATRSPLCLRDQWRKGT